MHKQRVGQTTKGLKVRSKHRGSDILNETTELDTTERLNRTEPPLWQKVRRTKEPLDESERGE